MLGEWTAIMTILRPVRMRATIWPFSEERNVASNSVGFILALVLLPGVAQGVVTPVACAQRARRTSGKRSRTRPRSRGPPNTVQHPSHCNALVRPVVRRHEQGA